MDFKRTLPALALAGAAGLLTVPAVLAAEEAPRDAVERLMPGLLSSDDTQRTAAEKELFALGDAGRKELERITRETDPRRAVTALRLLQSERWAPPAKGDGPQRARREGSSLLDDAEIRMDDLRAQVERQLEQMRRELAELDHTFSLRIPQFDFEGARPHGRASGSLIEDDRSLQYTIEEDGRVKVSVKDGKDAPEKVYEAESLDALRREAPEIAERLEPLLGGGGRFVLRFAGPNARGLRLDGHPFAGPPGERDDVRSPESAQPHVLGIEWAPVPDVLREQLGLADGGVAIERVVPGSLAEKLGLKRHDLLLEVQGKSVSGSPDVRAALDGVATGDKVTALVLRKGERQTLEATK